MYRAILILLFSLFSMSLIAQDVLNPSFQKELQSLLDFDTPHLNVEELRTKGLEQYQVLDAREREEYNVSHIPSARYVGYDDFTIGSISDIDTSTPIVVYCSVGYRSEKITQQLIKNGYTQVYNLVGSIFEWANCGYPLENTTGENTLELHTYNKKWSRWVDRQAIIKVW